MRYYGRNEIHIRREMFETELPFRLSYDEIDNFGTLRVHGLAVHVENDGERKAGYWLLTRRAALFLRGDVAIPKRVKVVNGDPVEHSRELVRVSDLSRSEPWFDLREYVNVEKPESDGRSDTRQMMLLP